MNPEIAEVLPKENLVSTIGSLVYVAVTLNKKLLKTEPESQEKKDASTYLDTCWQNRKNWINEITE